jgi:hypothetical protein
MGGSGGEAALTPRSITKMKHTRIKWLTGEELCLTPTCFPPFLEEELGGVF